MNQSYQLTKIFKFMLKNSLNFENANFRDLVIISFIKQELSSQIK